MDFFNSIGYGRHPYEQGVIYPPLMNVIYAFFGHFVSHEDMIMHGVQPLFHGVEIRQAFPVLVKLPVVIRNTNI